MNKFTTPPVSADPAIEAENFRLHTIHDDGYESNWNGMLLKQNPHPPQSIEFSAWESGYLQAQDDMEEDGATA